MNSLVSNDLLPCFKRMLSSLDCEKVGYYEYPFEEFEFQQSSSGTWDIPYLIDATKNWDSPVLELFSGSGRLTKHLVSSGLRVTALDSSLACVQRMKNSFRNNDIRIINKNVFDQNLDIGTLHCGTVIADLSINSFLTESDLSRLFELTLRLNKNGSTLLFFCLSEPPTRVMSVYKGNIFPVVFQGKGKKSNLLWTAIDYDPENLSLIQNCYMESQTNEMPERYFSIVKERFWLTNEVTPILHKAGYKSISVVPCEIPNGDLGVMNANLIEAK